MSKYKGILKSNTRVYELNFNKHYFIAAISWCITMMNHNVTLFKDFLFGVGFRITRKS